MSKTKKYGSSQQGKGKIIILDYPSVNIAKPMSVGHLRSAIIGQSLYNIYKFLGHKSISDDHLGDWGTQFGNMICAYKKWGDKKKIAKDPIKELLALYVRFHQEAEQNKDLEEEGRAWFAKLEKGDKEAAKLWKQFKKWSMNEFKKTYNRLGIKTDYAPTSSGLSKACISSRSFSRPSSWAS
ncbi:MAG: arginine--tRNA ligase, partial [Candidatus Aenigmarchaeota archaeon]|nr:arginine--tRNA ligase [Candidatus Aenigmarchaeota archaeon]